VAESAEKVAQQAEERLDRVAETVRKKFDAITGSRFGSKPGQPVGRPAAADRRDPADRTPGGKPTADRSEPGGKGRKRDRRS
jgi:hypothetical protein